MKDFVKDSTTPINQMVERQDIEEPIPSTSFALPTSTVMNADAKSSNVVVYENPISRSENQANVESFSSLLNNLLPFPSIQKHKGIGKGRKIPQKQHSEILTATPLKVIFDEKARKRNEKILKGKESKKRKTNDRRNQVKKNLFSSNSLYSLIDECEREYDEAEVYLSDPSKPSDQNECIICLEEDKNNEMWYRCRACGKWRRAKNALVVTNQTTTFVIFVQFVTIQLILLLMYDFPFFSIIDFIRKMQCH